MRLKLKTLIISLILVPLINAQTPEQLPEGTRENYVRYRDASVSDEFDGASMDWDKWKRRNSGGISIEPHVNDASLVQMESTLENDLETRYVSIKGIANSVNDLKTAGIVGSASSFYGFYVVRFQYKGFDNEKTKTDGNIWHPSVWFAIGNSTHATYRSAGSHQWWLEIDMMEWEGQFWSSDAPAVFIDSKSTKPRKVITSGPNLEKAIMRGQVRVFDDRWQTIGMEYTPDKLKLWEWKNGQWVHIGEREVSFLPHNSSLPESEYTIGSVGKKSVTPGFWHLGNIVPQWLIDRNNEGKSNSDLTAMEVNYDFFRYYRHVDAVDMDWPWENNIQNGGPGVLKDTTSIRPVVDSNTNPNGEIIIDNGDVGYTEVGTWHYSSLLGLNSSDTRYAGKSIGPSATWTPTITEAGRYEVSVYKIVHSSTDPNVKIEVVHSGGTDTQYLNYTTGTSGWVTLGIYEFSKGTTGYVKKSLNTEGTHIRADAVKFKLLPINSTNVSQENQGSNLSGYPNPTANFFSIAGLKAGRYELHIININGKSVHEKLMSTDSQKAFIDVSTLTKGIYFLHVKGEQVNKTVKFSKI